jgi:hypothetical protein
MAPYYIAKDRPGCESGWSVVKGDGEVIDCKETKTAAVRQMVAMSIGEGIEPGGEWNKDD